MTDFHQTMKPVPMKKFRTKLPVKFLLTFALLIFISGYSVAQMKQIRGSVQDKNGKPLSSVQISEKNYGSLTKTNSRGEFVFNYNVPMSGAVPVFNFVKTGYFPYAWEYDRTDNKKVVMERSIAIDISGKVTDERGEALQNVKVEMKGDDSPDYTDGKGVFTFVFRSKKAGETPTKFKFTKSGYETAYWDFVSNQNPTIILRNLNPSNIQVTAVKQNTKEPQKEDDLEEINQDLEEMHVEIDTTASLSNEKLTELKEYIAYLETILETNDVTFNREAMGQDSTIHRELKSKLTDLKTKVEIKEKEVKTEKKKNFMLWIAIALIILILIPTILAIVFYRNNKKTKKLNVQLDKQNQELKIAYHNIHSSVVYAQRIQQSILIKPEGIKQHFNDAFVFFRPKDIVSGDFYWFGQLGNKLIITAVDCTGHGVPGAFMTMMGNTMLNEIVHERNITDPGEILKELHNKIQNALKASGDTESNDGMDIALACVDSDTKSVKFAGANNPLYFICNKEFKTIKGERSGLGGTKNKSDLSFTTHDIDVSEIDRFYLVSDGFQDQFGGTQNRKYMKKRFKNLLLDISEKPFSEQEKILDKELEEWKGNKSQTDDVLVIGVKL